MVKDVKKLSYKRTVALHDKLFNQGFDVCRGCEYERYAACNRARLRHCKAQIQKVIDTPDEMRGPAWWKR